LHYKILKILPEALYELSASSDVVVEAPPDILMGALLPGLVSGALLPALVSGHFYQLLYRGHN
jgi:hypothetical protein